MIPIILLLIVPVHPGKVYHTVQSVREPPLIDERTSQWFCVDETHKVHDAYLRERNPPLDPLFLVIDLDPDSLRQGSVLEFIPTRGAGGSRFFRVRIRTPDARVARMVRHHPR